VLLSDSARGGMTRRYGLRRWLGLTPKRPALCLRGLQKVIARECSEEKIFRRACGLKKVVRFLV
jgi:hypothetical protein